MAVTPGIQVEVQVVAGELAVEQLDTTDLDDAVALIGIQAGGFGVQEYLSHGGMSVAPGRPKPLTHPLGGQRTQRAWGQLHFSGFPWRG